MMAQVTQDAFEFVKKYYDEEFNEIYTYHDLSHTLEVYDVAMILASEMTVSPEDRMVLQIATLFHDIGYATNVEDHEEESARIAREFLQAYDLAPSIKSRIESVILSTKMGWEGLDPLSWIIRDADLSHIGSKGYLHRFDALRKELNVLHSRSISEAQWLQDSLDFFGNHTFHTVAAVERFEKRKWKNLKKLRAKVEGLVVESQDPVTLAKSKSAQTQVKTALRNHIDLSAIADSKASMMVTINAMILTVGLPLLISNLGSVPQLFATTIVVACTSVVSMIFATMATRPITMSGTTDITQIPQKRTNLFFFGNFYKMDFSDYEEGINEVIANDDILNNSITRDLFFLGKSLGRKYDQLRFSYNVFMLGISLATVLGLVFFFLNVCPR